MDIKKAQKPKKYHIIIPKLLQNISRNDNYQHPKHRTLLILV